MPRGLIEGIIGLIAVAVGLFFAPTLGLGRAEAELMVIGGVIAADIGLLRALVARGRSRRFGMAVAVTPAVIAIGLFLWWPQIASDPVAARDALDAAITRGDAAAVQAALDAGADPDVSGSPLATPLIVAAGRGDVPVVRALLAAGAAPELATPSGMTPLIAAVTRRQPAVIPVLIAAGADPGTVSTYGSARGLAADDPEIRALLTPETP